MIKTKPKGVKKVAKTINSTLTKITTEAKKIRKKNPSIKWTDAIKLAANSINGVKKAASKKADKKKVVAVKKKAAQKKVTVKKKATPKKFLSMHKDTKSHNVNIRVISGVKVYGIEQYKKCIADLSKWEKILKQLEKEKLIAPKEYKGAILRDIKLVKNQIKECKTHARELKKHI